MHCQVGYGRGWWQGLCPGEIVPRPRSLSTCQRWTKATVLASTREGGVFSRFFPVRNGCDGRSYPRSGMLLCLLRRSTTLPVGGLERRTVVRLPAVLAADPGRICVGADIHLDHGGNERCSFGIDTEGLGFQWPVARGHLTSCAALARHQQRP